MTPFTPISGTGKQFYDESEQWLAMGRGGVGWGLTWRD